MKLILHVFIFFAISTKLFSQTATPASKITYLDSSWVESTEDNYKYIRIVEEYFSDKKAYVLKEYYKSKALKMIGTTTDKDVIKREGQFVYYYENGNKKSTVNYQNNKKTGKEFPKQVHRLICRNICCRFREQFYAVNLMKIK